MAVVLNYSLNLASAKPPLLENPFLRNQAVQQQPGDQISLPQSDVIGSEELTSQANDVPSVIDAFVDSRIAHNRTSRNAHPCIEKWVKGFDYCRNRTVTTAVCFSMHPACNHVVAQHYEPKCQTVYGFKRAKFVMKCPPLAVDCECPAK